MAVAESSSHSLTGFLIQRTVTEKYILSGATHLTVHIKSLRRTTHGDPLLKNGQQVVGRQLQAGWQLFVLKIQRIISDLL